MEHWGGTHLLEYWSILKRRRWAIYLSMRVALAGRAGLATNDDVRRWVLRESGTAVVPFNQLVVTTPPWRRSVRRPATD